MVNKCHCGKGACFNVPTEKKGIYCVSHRLSGMINVINKLCEDPTCEPRLRASFNFPGLKPIMCSNHALDGMVNMNTPTCKGSTEQGAKKCYQSPVYNYMGEKKALYCITHRLENMVNVIGKRCEDPLCIKKTIASFNYPGERPGRFCAKHRLDDMVDIRHDKCEFEGCGVSPSFKFESDSACRFCSDHRLDGMIDGKHRKCAETGCNTAPSYNYEEEYLPLYCLDHRLDEMVDVIHKRCKETGCIRRPLCNFPNETHGIYCVTHRLDGMENVVSKKCQETGCIVHPSYNFPHEKQGLYCVTHRLDGMDDVVSQKCASDWCNTSVRNKYDGYCLFCFVNLFPEKPVARNYKTKERTIVDFVLAEFPDVSWVADKRVQHGCSRRRPDLLLDLGYQVIIIEVDENQHTAYDCSCENKRIMELSQDNGHRPVIFIRFNPDLYITNTNATVRSCWRANQNGIFVVKDNTLWLKRLDLLKQQVTYWLHNTSDKTVETIQLCYDGFLPL